MRGSLALFLLVAACSGRKDPTTRPVRFPIRGAWLAPRQGSPLDSRAGSRRLAELRALGVTHVAVGPVVQMPHLLEPHLEWGGDDEALRSYLRRAREAGLGIFLLPRIESPDFFLPPYPFRADIGFDSEADWGRFHADLRRMILHYARLAQEEHVALFGLGLELKKSVRAFPAFWRGTIARVREVFHGPLTYSANWFDEWQQVPFWDALDYIGVGAYFELRPAAGARASMAEVVARWRPIQARLARLAARFSRKVIFTEVGYTGYADCIERPWEWSGKEKKGVPIDFCRQALAWRALLRAFRDEPWFEGLFAWSFYTSRIAVKDWEYAITGRPAEAVLRAAFARGRD